MLRLQIILVFCASLVACSQQPTRSSAESDFTRLVPADLSGSWERDYWRGDDVNRALDRWFRRLRRAAPDLRPAGITDLDNAGTITTRGDVTTILALARLADEITRFRTFSISQSENEISVEREDDFDIFCEFYDEVAQGAITNYGVEICGWNGDQFISRLILSGGLLVSHRFTVAPDSLSLNVATTVSSTTTGMSFTLSRFYSKYEQSPSQFDCIDTLSRNRVCTTGGISP